MKNSISKLLWFHLHFVLSYVTPRRPFRSSLSSEPSTHWSWGVSLSRETGLVHLRRWDHGSLRVPPRRAKGSWVTVADAPGHELSGQVGGDRAAPGAIPVAVGVSADPARTERNPLTVRRISLPLQ